MKTLILLLAPLAACTMTAPTVPDAPAAGTVNYTCKGGYVVPVTYGAEGDGTKSVVITVDGANYTLLEEPVASGQRFAWPSDGSNFVWVTKGGVGTVLWHDGTNGTEAPRFTECKS
jgi:membrane-bound inhibitor of C-type lysozyme